MSVERGIGTVILEPCLSEFFSLRKTNLHLFFPSTEAYLYRYSWDPEDLQEYPVSSDR